MTQRTRQVWTNISRNCFQWQRQTDYRLAPTDYRLPLADCWILFRARDVVNAYKFSITPTKCTAQVQVCRLSLSFVSGQAHYWLPSSDVAYRKWIRVFLVWLSPSNWVCGWPAVRLSVKLLFPYALWRFVSPMMRDVEQRETASGRVSSIERHPKCLTA